jgi:hypothetical protein
VSDRQRRANLAHQDEILDPAAEADEKIISVPTDLRIVDLRPDVQVSMHDHPEEGYYNPVDFFLNPEQLESALPLIRRVNRHSAVVLENPPLERALQSQSAKAGYDYALRKEAEKILKQKTLIPDLDESPPPDYVPLTIADHQRLYLDSTNGQTQSVEDDLVQYWKAIQEKVEGWKADTEHFELRYTNEVLTEVLNSTMNSMNASQTEGTSFPETFLKELKHYFVIGNELLRHFWSTLPVTSCNVDRIQRISTSLEKLYRQVENFYQTLNNSPECAILLDPILGSLNKARKEIQTLAEKNPQLFGSSSNSTITTTTSTSTSSLLSTSPNDQPPTKKRKPSS